MTRFLRQAALVATIAVSTIGVHGGDAVTLRPQAPLYVGGDGVGLSQPRGVGCGSGPTLVVADTGNGRLVLFAIEDTAVTPQEAIRVREVPRPVRAQVGSEGEIFVLDGRSRRIARLSPTGTFSGFVEPAVDGTTVVRSFVIDDDDHLYLLDVFSGRVLVLDDQAAVQREIAFPESYGTISDLALAPDGDVLLLDSSGRRVFVAGSNDPMFIPFSESLDEDLDFATGIAVDAFGRAYVADQSGGGIVILGTDGSFRGRQSDKGFKPGFLRYPAGLCVHDGKTLFVADRGNDRVQVFTIAQ
jgi:DNA-binding beta-propeller fold protein YncE